MVKRGDAAGGTSAVVVVVVAVVDAAVVLFLQFAGCNLPNASMLENGKYLQRARAYIFTRHMTMIFYFIII